MTHLQSTKTALIMSSLLLLTPCVQAMDNLYVGAQGGSTYLSIDNNSSTVVQYGDPGITSNPHNFGGLADLFVGYRLDAPHRDVFAAVELNASGILSENKYTANDSIWAGPNYAGTTSTDKIEANFGLSMKVGRLFSLMNHNTNAYIIFGGGAAIFNHEVSQPDQPWEYISNQYYDHNFTQTEPYLRGGIGLSQDFAQHLSWQVEYDYYYYNSFNKSVQYPSTDETTYIYTYKPKMQTLMSGITYTF